MDGASRTRASKRLSFVLRHRPDSIGVELDAHGWIDVATLLAALATHGPAMSREELVEVVETNTKRRFALSEDGLRIRASQGHSVDVDLDYAPMAPPDELFHGTHEGVAAAIESEGLVRGSRHHVHLSGDVETARTVGARRGKAVLFVVDARRMHADGITFFRSDNGVWLTEHVAPSYLRRVAR